MGSLIVSTRMTLDAVIEVDDPYVVDGEHDRASKEQLMSASAVLLGRKTSESLAVPELSEPVALIELDRELNVAISGRASFDVLGQIGAATLEAKILLDITLAGKGGA